MKDSKFKAGLSTLFIILINFPQLSMGMGANYATQSGSWNKFGWYKPGMNTGSEAAVTTPVLIPQSSVPNVWTEYVPTWKDKVRNFGYQYIKDPATNLWYKGQYYGQKLYDAAASYVGSVYNTAEAYGRAAKIDAYNTTLRIYNFPYLQWAKQNPGYIFLGVAVIGTAAVGIYYFNRAYASKEKINEAKRYIELRNQLNRALDRLLDKSTPSKEIDMLKSVFNDNLRSVEFSFQTIRTLEGYAFVKKDMNLVFDTLSEYGIEGNEEDVKKTIQKLIEIVDKSLEKLGVKLEKQ